MYTFLQKLSYQVAVIQVIIQYAFSPLTQALSHPLGGEGQGEGGLKMSKTPKIIGAKVNM